MRATPDRACIRCPLPISPPMNTPPPLLEVINVRKAFPKADGSELLVVAPLDVSGRSEVHLGAADGPALVFADLPYALTDAA